MIALLSLIVWIYLCCAHGRFWISGPELPPAAPAVPGARADAPDADAPDVDIVVPARNEAEHIGASIASLLAQDYPGRVRVILVDDHSTDGTAQCAGSAPNLRILQAAPKPEGWSGKLWALHQGAALGGAPLVLFTDADIVHDPRHLSALVSRLQSPGVDMSPRVDMVSEMVRLNCRSLAERALVPAFVYFFQMLYPFAQVNNPGSRIAAAAGGTVLIRREALERIGGIAAIKRELIDDVALAKAVKSSGAIYLGHTSLAASVRPYPRFVDLWRMISRTAFTQLRCSPALLGLTLLGLTLVWLVPVWAMAFGRGGERLFGLAAFCIAALSYLPTLGRYGRSRLWCLSLPLIAVFYMAATAASALNHWRGVGANWKDRAYGAG